MGDAKSDSAIHQRQGRRQGKFVGVRPSRGTRLVTVSQSGLPAPRARPPTPPDTKARVPRGGAGRRTGGTTGLARDSAQRMGCVQQNTHSPPQNRIHCESGGVAWAIEIYLGVGATLLERVERMQRVFLISVCCQFTCKYCNFLKNENFLFCKNSSSIAKIVSFFLSFSCFRNTHGCIPVLVHINAFPPQLPCCEHSRLLRAPPRQPPSQAKLNIITFGVVTSLPRVKETYTSSHSPRSAKLRRAGGRGRQQAGPGGQAGLAGPGTHKVRRLQQPHPSL